MFRPRTLKFLAAFIAGIVLLWGAALVWPGFVDSLAGRVLAVPYLSLYVFHGMGIPGLLQNDGLCGWGWCAPTLYGWGVLIFFWLLIAWLIAWAAASLTSSQPVQ